MNQNQELKIQSFIDHELPPQEALDVAEWIARDADAKRLHVELQLTRSLTVGNEMPRSAPCSPEFFWSQVEREIKRQTPEKSKPTIELDWIWRFLAPASALLLMAIMILPQRQGRVSEIASIAGPEVETAIQDANVITFRSDSEGISVVWVDVD